ncbi:energy transducer TonB [Sphingobium lignivorans]|uniref:Protein TonB n=1 Tax=Sphingobium lignivorans TaxID=2735886 RepID=A0ABR6NKD3_9SPHN|nr:energy transducer TonB [Sphingobium lignivorans]MBB5987735.1 protein TonB [Sphingobium lignivorans]
MSDMSVPRSTYGSRRSPAAMAAALALNGGLFALLIALPVAVQVIPADPPIRIRHVPLDPLPAPVPEPQKTESPRNVVQPVIAHPVQPDPIRVEPLVPLDTGPQIALSEFRLPTTPAEPIAPIESPAEPVLHKARPDPRFADAFRPAYPAALRRDGLEGSVTVRVTIDPRGRVTDVEMVSASNPVFFEETRRQALRFWRFVPATRDGVAVQSVQTMTVHFRLEN